MDAPRIGQLIKKLTTQKTQNIKKSSISSILSIIIIIINIIIIIIIILYNFVHRSTYNHLSSWLTDARNLTNPNTVIFLIGNKSDLEAQVKPSKP